MERQLRAYVEQQVACWPQGEYFRAPLVSFSAAADPLYDELKNIVGPHHLHPRDLLAGVETVVVFFVPFSRAVVQENRKATGTAESWARAYIAGNALINHVTEGLAQLLEDAGHRAMALRATHNFDEKTLLAPWSHRSAAYISGMGSFGLNRLLITERGCAGRFGSLVTTAGVPPGRRQAPQRCHHYLNGRCSYCLDHCPTGALQAESLDKPMCYAHLLEMDKSFPELGLCDVCGKCAVGPCAIFEPEKDA